MKVFSSSGYNKVRIPKRASYKWSDISRIIDAIAIGHVSFIEDSRPFVIPLNVWRMGEYLYLHCLKGGRLGLQLPLQEMACISFAEHDAWVLSKSAYHTSANYRSVVLHGRFVEVDNNSDEFMESFATLLNSIEVGRWEKVRPLSHQEIKATTVLRFEIENAAAKSRTGRAAEEAADLTWPVTAGILPLRRIQDDLEEAY